MGLVQLFIESKMPALLADLVMSKVPNVQSVIISAFIDNIPYVATMLPVVTSNKNNLTKKAGAQKASALNNINLYYL